MNEENERTHKNATQTDPASNQKGVHAPTKTDYLADVLRVWDCDEQRWLGAAPIILRFENEDVLLRARTLSDRFHDLDAEAPDAREADAGKGAASKQHARKVTAHKDNTETSATPERDTKDPSAQESNAWTLRDTETVWECRIDPVQTELALGDLPNNCLCWRSDREFSALIGSETSTCETCRNIHSALKLHSAEAKFLRLLDTKAGELSEVRRTRAEPASETKLARS